MDFDKVVAKISLEDVGEYSKTAQNRQRYADSTKYTPPSAEETTRKPTVKKVLLVRLNGELEGLLSTMFEVETVATNKEAFTLLKEKRGYDYAITVPDAEGYLFANFAPERFGQRVIVYGASAHPRQAGQAGVARSIDEVMFLLRNVRN